MQKNYVLDTNVLIDNPYCIKTLRNGQENRVILPYTVLRELDKLKREPRVAHVVAQAITALQDDSDILFLPPCSFPDSESKSGDDLILEELIGSGVEAPILVTNDRILQLKARIHSISCEGYRDSNPFRSESQSYTGFVREGEEPIPNSFAWIGGQPFMHATSGSRFIDYQHSVWNVRPRNVYQNLALELLLDDAVNLVTIQSEAGYGKTFLALAAALFMALEQKDNPYRKIYLVKPVIEIGAKPLVPQKSQEQALRGHGNAGEMPALVAQGLGQENDGGFSALGEIGPELVEPDGRTVRAGVVQGVAVAPGVEDGSGRGVVEEFQEGAHGHGLHAGGARRKGSGQGLTARDAGLLPVTGFPAQIHEVNG